MNYKIEQGWCITMNCYELLLDECEKNNITVVEKKFKSKAKGLWKNGRIGISVNIPTVAEKNCILAEEYGHHKTTVGNITNLKDIRNLKQETVARAVAIEKLCSLEKIVDAHKKGAINRYEIAEMLNITVDFFNSAIEHHRKKHDIYCTVNGVTVQFEPFFGIYIL